MKIIEKLASRVKDAFASPTVLIACLGDSVTHACFEIYPDRNGVIASSCRPSDGYASKLISRINEYFPVANVGLLNAGIGGDNAPNGLARLERDVLSHKPDLVTVNFGLNDSMGGMEKLPVYEKAMDAIFARILESGAECILVTPNRMNTYVSPLLTEPSFAKLAAHAAEIQNAGVLDAYVNAARAIAKKHNVPVADSYAVWQTLETSGVDTTSMLCNHINHPSPSAHNIFVDEIFRTMLGLN